MEENKENKININEINKENNIENIKIKKKKYGGRIKLLDDMFRFRLTKKEKEDLQKYATLRRMCMSEFIRGILVDYIQKERVREFLGK